MSKLNEKQKAFADYYIESLNATESYKKAYEVENQRTAESAGSRMLSNVEVKKYIDEVVRIIKNSKSVTDAKITLIKTFDLSEIQAQAILDMQLRRLSGLNREKILQEHKDLHIECDNYRAILAQSDEFFNRFFEYFK